MEDRKVTGIMACDPSGVIGLEGSLPWRFESEMQHFLKVVEGGVLIMGRKTFESLPQSLKDSHRCVVFSRNTEGRSDEGDAVFISSLEEFERLDMPRQSKLFMIGGAEIAHLFLQNNLISEFILTIMHKEYTGDTKLDLNLLKDWAKETLSSCDNYTVYRYVPNFIQKLRDKNDSATQNKSTDNRLGSCGSYCRHLRCTCQYAADHGVRHAARGATHNHNRC